MGKTTKGKQEKKPRTQAKHRTGSRAKPTEQPPAKYFHWEKNALPEADSVFTELLKLPFEKETGMIHGKHFELDYRKTCAISFVKDPKTDKPIIYKYSGKGRRHYWWKDPKLGAAGDLLWALAKAATAKTGKVYQTGIVTFYHDPTQKAPFGLGYHSDASPNFKKGGSVACWVLGRGTPRGMRFREKGDTSAVGKWIAFPAHGDFYEMPPGCQDDTQHAVEKGKPGDGPRVSLTLREMEEGGEYQDEE